MIKIMIAVFLSIGLVLVLAGCDREPLPKDHPANSGPNSPIVTRKPKPVQSEAPTESTEEDAPSEVPRLMTPLEEYGLSVDNIYWANLMTYLLNRNGTVKTITCTDDIKFVEGYISCNDSTAVLFTTIHPDGRMECSGFFDRYMWELQGDRVVARTFVEYLEDEYYTSTVSENAVNCCFMDAQAAVISASDSEYLLYVNNYLGDCIVTLDRNTLDIKRVEYSLGDGEDVVVEYIYGEIVEGAELFDTWNGQKKNVTIAAEMYDGDTATKTEKTFEMAADWELVPESWEEIALYGNETYTQEYQYPGYGEDYTVYVTNAMG